MWLQVERDQLTRHEIIHDIGTHARVLYRGVRTRIKVPSGWVV